MSLHPVEYRTGKRKQSRFQRAFRIAILCIAFLPVCIPVAAQRGILSEQVSASFDHPVSVRNAGDGSGRLFVVDVKVAQILWFIDTPASTAMTFLDLSDRVDASSGEEGLLGLAFHPDYDQNGYFYVNYTAASPDRSVVSRFTVSSLDPNVADPNSEVVLLEVDQPGSKHNGGDLAFGPDGYLYLSFGDGGVEANAQDRTNLLGTILRIDVDQTQSGLNYAIPPSNPFVGNVDDYREEIWAYGFRNPWRFSISGDGRVWVGDVGEDAIEEIDIAEAGKNYGWPTMEGSTCYNAVSCDMTGLELPFYEYGREDGSTVTGGYLYRGSAPSLFGKYIFGDFNRRIIYVLDVSGATPVLSAIDGMSPQVVGFGEDENGELYICAYTGSVSRLEEPLGIDLELPQPVAGPRSAFEVAAAFPNPSEGSFDIQVQALRSAVANVEVVDYLGRRIQSMEISVAEGSQTLTLDLSGVAPGVYLARIGLPGKSVSATLFVAR